MQPQLPEAAALSDGLLCLPLAVESDQLRAAALTNNYDAVLNTPTTGCGSAEQA
jgi:hypothetical protein